MKNNLFLKIPILFLVFALGACSDDDNSSLPQEDFFNLNLGNQWVYKRYNFDFDNPSIYTFSGETEHVEVVEIVSINGLNFSKLKHTKTYANSPNSSIEYEYLRVNESGHLVGFMGAVSDIDENFITENFAGVLHPGEDFSYQFIRTEPYGTITHQLTPRVSMTVEGNNYSVFPYKGVFVPNSSDLVTKTVEYNYQKQIGLVKRVCHTVSGSSSWEDRLVSYTIVN